MNGIRYGSLLGTPKLRWSRTGIRSERLCQLKALHIKRVRSPGQRRTVRALTRCYSSSGLGSTEESNSTRLSFSIGQFSNNLKKKLTETTFRRIAWRAIVFLSGFYTANMVALAFGALAVNDVFAAFIFLVFSEVITRLNYRPVKRRRPQEQFYLNLLNFFKLGFTYGFFCDSFKLGG